MIYPPALIISDISLFLMYYAIGVDSVSVCYA